LIDKGKSLQTLEDLTQEDKSKLEKESLNQKPDILIDSFKDLPDYAENSYIDGLIVDNIDNTLKKLIDQFPTLSKRSIVEKLIEDNPTNKEKILSVVSQTLNEQLSL
jgi:hypothetical protein